MIDRFLISSVAWQGVRHSEAIAQVRAAGFGGVEILCKPGHFEPGNRAYVEDALRGLDGWTNAEVTLHAPFYDVHLAATDADGWSHAVREAMLALEAASRLKAGSMTIHVRSMTAAERWDGGNVEAFGRSLQRLIPAASERSVGLAVENFPPPYFTANERDLLGLIEGFPSVGTCIDTGHAHLAHRLVEIARALAERALVAHLHDNSACGRDEHLIPGRGTIAWREFVEAMRGFRGRPVMEVGMTGTLGETLANVEKAIRETGLEGLVGA